MAVYDITLLTWHCMDSLEMFTNFHQLFSMAELRRPWVGFSMHPLASRRVMTLWRWGNFPEISKWSNYSDGSWLEILGYFFDFQMVELITLVGVFLIYPDAMQICVQLYHIIDLWCFTVYLSEWCRVSTLKKVLPRAENNLLKSLKNIINYRGNQIELWHQLCFWTALLLAMSVGNLFWSRILVSSWKEDGSKLRTAKSPKPFFAAGLKVTKLLLYPKIGRRCMVVLNITNLLMFRVYLVFHFSSHSRFGWK